VIGGPRRLAARLGGLGLLLTALSVASQVAASQDESPLLLGSDPRVEQANLEVTVFADALPYPLGMVELEDGSLLVGTSLPTGGGLFDSTGELVRLVDADADGVASAPGDVVASGLPGTITAVQRIDDLIYTISIGTPASRITLLRLGPTPADPLETIGEIAIVTDPPAEHGSYALAVRPDPANRDRHDLFFNAGALSNDSVGATVTLSGLATGTSHDATLNRLSVDTSGATPIFSDLTVVATGLRNAASIAFDPVTGDLWLEDNGIDTPEIRIEALSADELNRIEATAIDGEAEDFGFPAAYVDYQTGEPIGAGGVPPEVAFTPLNGQENEGPMQIAFLPSGLLPGLDRAIVVGFHGQWDLVGLNNEENPLLVADLTSGDLFPLVSNDDPNVGHLDGLLATSDALYVADLSGRGSLAGVESSGVIYRIAARSAGSEESP